MVQHDPEVDDIIVDSSPQTFSFVVEQQEEFELRTQIDFAFDGNFESVDREGYSSNKITFFFLWYI